MKKEEREIIRLAEEMGITGARIVPKGRHPRLVGTFGGREISIVCSTSKGKFLRRHGSRSKVISNISEALKRM